MNFKQEILKSIQLIIDEKISSYKTDKTYKSVVKRVTPKGYVIFDESGSERTVQCCIPGVSLKVGDKVLVKIPNGDLNQIHIVGISGNTTVVTTATKIGSSTVGNTRTPIYIDKGVVTQCNSTVGSVYKPVYMNAGTLTECNSSTIIYSDTEPLDLSIGTTWIDI